MSLLRRGWPFLFAGIAAGCEPGASDSPAAAESGGESAAPPDLSGMNVVLYMTDDQRWDALGGMPTVQERLVAPGVVFERAYVDTPLCCPARASFLSGGFLAQHSGVIGNDAPDGGATRFEDENSLPARLLGAGYRTGMVGKYLNDYGAMVPEVPRGWSHFDSVMPDEDWTTYTTIVGSSTADERGVGERHAVDEYLTDYITDQSVAFLEEEDEHPFFLWVTQYAPHFPAVVAPEDVGTYAGATWRGGAFNEADVSDKPAWVRALPLADAETIAAHDEVYERSLESLLAADRGLARVLDAVEAAGLTDRTVILFASDNGFLFGEHRLFSKGVPYEESVRVPLVVYNPALTPGTRTELVSVTTDVAATIAEIAGLTPLTDGVSLTPLLTGETLPWRSDLLLEGYHVGDSPDYSGFVTDTRKYVEYVDGDSELYDLAADPTEGENVVHDPRFAAEVTELSATLATQKGLAVVSSAGRLTVGVAGSIVLHAVGGTAPLTWSLESGPLPDGVTLDPAGSLDGTPTAEGAYVLEVRATDSSVSPYTGDPQSFAGRYLLQVSAPAVAPVVVERPRLTVTLEGRRAHLRVDSGVRGEVRVTVGLDPDLENNPWHAGKLSDGQAAASFVTPELHAGACFYAQADAGLVSKVQRFCVGG